MSDICKFCKDSNLEKSEILCRTEVPMGPMNIDSGVWIGCKDVDITNGFDPTLYFGMEFISNKNHDTIDFYGDSMPINYCPFCGRYLREDYDTNLHKIMDLRESGILPTMAANALLRGGVIFLEDLSYITEKECYGIRHIGKGSLNNIKKAMMNYGVEFAKKSVIKEQLSALKPGVIFSYVDYSDLKKPKRTRNMIFLENGTYSNSYFVKSADEPDDKAFGIYLCRFREIASIRFS